MKKLLAPLLIALIAGCASPPPPPQAPAPRPRPAPPKKAPVRPPAPSVLEIDRSYSAKGQSSRVKFIIVHYTVSNTPRSLKTLTQDSVSSHYLLTDEREPTMYGLVDETRQSNHAGVSTWKNYTLLNGSSIGIEIVNPGFTEGPNGRQYYPFPQAQIDKLILLLKDIVARHQIPPENILGHSDIAPLRKQDPGPMFPWAQLARHGLVLWPDAGRVAAARVLYDQQLPDARWFQQKLAAHGYSVPRTGELDEQTRTVISAFQMKYRPQDFGGFPDSETAAMLEAMNPTPVTAPVSGVTVRTIPQPVFTVPVRPAPVAPAPVSPAPVVPGLVAPAQVIPAPIAPAPIAPAPIIPAPAVPAPAAPAPVAPQPVAPAPVVPVPAVPAPVAPAPIVPAPAAPAPVAPAPALPAPVAPAPVTPAPAVEPAPVQPVAPTPAAPSPDAPAPVAPAPTRP
jgi:N-acetylmuramoyl-L-alanine amidase